MGSGFKWIYGRFLQKRYIIIILNHKFSCFDATFHQKKIDSTNEQQKPHRLNQSEKKLRMKRKNGNFSMLKWQNMQKLTPN